MQEFYKCLPKSLFTNNMLVDTDSDFYGNQFSYTLAQIKDLSDYIINNTKNTGFPINLFFFLLGIKNGKPYDEGGLESILKAKIYRNYKMKELVISNCGDLDITYTHLELLFQDAPKIKDYSLKNGDLFKQANWVWEALAEKIRQEKFCDLPKRETSYFLFKTKNDAQNYIKDNGKRGFIIVKAIPTEIKSLMEFDMKIWDEDCGKDVYSKCENQMIRYWSSKNNPDNQVPEVLFSGKLRLESL